MDSEALRVLAENRAQSDTKQLKKSIKEFYALLKPNLPKDQLEALHTTFSITLSQLSTHLSKSTRISQVTSHEISQYSSERSEIDQQSEQTREKIDGLNKRLVQVREERSRRIEYDALTKGIKKLPEREKGIESKAKLESDIELLKLEETNYLETWNTRKLAFDSIVNSLESMQEAIRDEKAEQERRRALDDAEEDEEIVEDPTATTTGGAVLDPNALPFVPGGKTETGEENGDEEMQEVEGRVEGEGEAEGEETRTQEKEEGEESIEEGEMDTR